MTDRITPPQMPETAAYEAEMLADLADLFGPARLAQMLAGLDEEIVRRLETARPDDLRLGANAHVLVSVSGTLGFMPLSSACAALEQACLAGTDVADPLDHAQAAAVSARQAIAALRAQVG